MVVQQRSRRPVELQIRVGRKLLLNFLYADSRIRVIGEKLVADSLDFTAQLLRF
jgi:hypothetical protein